MATGEASRGVAPFSELAGRPEHRREHDAHKGDHQSHDPARHVRGDEDYAEKYPQPDDPRRCHQPHEDRLDLEPSPLPPGEHRPISPGFASLAADLGSGVFPWRWNR